MDPHARWMRRHLATSVARRLGREASTVAALTFGLALASGLGVALAVPWAVTTAHLFVILRLLVALRSGLLSRKTAEAYLDRRLVFRAGVPEVTDPVSQLLVRRDLEPVTRLRAHADHDVGDDPTVDVFQSANRVTTALRSRVGSLFTPDTIRLVTRLDDGRLLVTAGQVIPPVAGLIVNAHPGALPTALLDDHRRAVRGLAAKGLHPVTSGADVAVDLLLLEQAGLAELGPFFAPFLAPGRNAPRLGLAVPVPPSALRRLGLTMPITKHSANRRLVQVSDRAAWLG